MGADKGTSMAAVGDEIGGGEGMQCSDHPYRNNPGGICAFCLQEKLGELVASSNSSTPFFSIPNPSSSSSSPSFRSNYGTMGPTTTTRTAGSGGLGGGGARTKVPFLSAAAAQKKKHSGGAGGVRKVITAHSSSSTTTTSFSGATKDVVVLKRSKSVAPRPIGGIVADATSNSIDSPRKRRFWSFLNKRSSDLKYQQQKQEEVVVKSNDVSHQTKADQEGCQSASSLGRKVSRSRSVGCGSRSFSGDFLERISTGFGDCTLRRVESHRESSKKVVVLHDSDEQRIIKERVKCGGIFGGFGMISSSSSYWLSAAAAAAAAAEDDEDFDRKIVNGSSMSRASTASIVRGAGGGKSRYWSWAFTSPMRAFRPAISSTSSSSSKSYEAKNGVTSISNGKISNGSNGKVCVNPSLLAVGS